MVLSLGSLGGFIRRVLSLGSLAGFSHWVLSLGSLAGFSLVSFTGFSHRVLSLGSLAGFFHWVLSLGSFSGFSLWVLSLGSLAGFSSPSRVRFGRERRRSTLGVLGVGAVPRCADRIHMQIWFSFWANLRKSGGEARGKWDARKNGDIGARCGRQVTLHPGHEKEEESNLIQSTGGNCMAGSCALLYGAFFY